MNLTQVKVIDCCFTEGQQSEIHTHTDAWFSLLCSVRAVFMQPLQRVCWYGCDILWLFLRLGDPKMQPISTIPKLWSFWFLWPPSPSSSLAEGTMWTIWTMWTYVLYPARQCNHSNCFTFFFIIDLTALFNFLFFFKPANNYFCAHYQTCDCQLPSLLNFFGFPHGEKGILHVT